MKRKDYTVVPVLIVVITSVIYFAYISSVNKKNRFNWYKTYSEGNREPYDFGTFRALLQQFTKGDFITVEKETGKALGKMKMEDSTAYIFAGRFCYLNKKEIDELMEFAEYGHTVFLIAEGVPDTLLQALSLYSKPVFIERFNESSVRIESENLHSQLRDFRFTYRGFNQDKTTPTDWYYLDEKQQLDYYYEESGNRYLKINRINGHLNYAKFKVGFGSIYIHTSPMLFTNYALLEDTGFIYVNEVFNGIRFKNVIYDIGSRTYKPDAETISRQSDSPLSYILSQPALKWAWYLFLLAVVLFFLFRAKRKQRMIPVLEKKKNTSLRFIETLSGLFYTQAHHKQMAETKMQMFLYFIRNKLNVSTHEINPETLRHISVRTGIQLREIEKIFEYYQQVVESSKDKMPPEILLELHNRISLFYQRYHSKK